MAVTPARSGSDGEFRHEKAALLEFDLESSPVGRSEGDNSLLTGSDGGDDVVAVAMRNSDESDSMTGDHLSDHQALVAAGGQGRLHLLRSRGRDHRRESNPHVERAKHFLFGD